MSRRLDASEREDLRPSSAVHAVINAATELTDREKRVYLADLFWWQGPEGSWVSAANLGKRLGLSLKAVELTRRALVDVGLQIVFDRPAGKTNGRICLLPEGTDPGARTPAEDCQAYALLLDSYLRRRRGPLPTTPEDEGSAKGIPEGRGVVGRASMVAPPLPQTTPDTREGARGSGEGIQGSPEGSPKAPKNDPKTTPNYRGASQVAQGSREGIPGSGGGGKGGVLNPPNLRSKSQSSMKLEEERHQKIERSFDPQEERGSRGEPAPASDPRTTPTTTPNDPPVNWRELVPRPKRPHGHHRDP